MDKMVNLALERLDIPAAAVSLDEASEALRSVADARRKLVSIEVQVAALRLARLFFERPELGWFRFYKKTSEDDEKEREPNARLVCDLWDAYQPFFPESLLYPEPDEAFEEDAEAERERLMLASLYRDLEAWTEQLGLEAFSRLASIPFERPEASSGSEEELSEVFLRQALSPEEYARWERARLARESRSSGEEDEGDSRAGNEGGRLARAPSL